MHPTIVNKRSNPCAGSGSGGMPPRKNGKGYGSDFLFTIVWDMPHY